MQKMWYPHIYTPTPLATIGTLGKSFTLYDGCGVLWLPCG